MQVNLLIHLEATGGDPACVWWAESPEMPGFSAAADHLPELLRQAQEAIDELVSDAEVVPTLAPLFEDETPPGPVTSRQETQGVESLRRVVVAA